MYVVVLVVKRSTEPEGESSFWRKNEIAIVMSLIAFVFPMIFEVLGLFEQYHPRKQLRLQLGRIMVLNLVNLYSLIFALIDKIGDMTTELQTFKNITKMLNESMSMSTTVLPIDYVTATECVCFSNKEPLLLRNQITENDLSDLTSQLSGLVANITTILVANITTTFNESISDIQSLNTSLTYFVNRIVQEKIIGTLNITIGNITNFVSQELNLTDIEFNLADYLTSLLFSLPDDDNSTITYENTTSISDNMTAITWEEFSSTIFPLLSSSDSTTDLGRFDYDFTSSTTNEFTSTILQEESTTEWPHCKEFCEQMSNPVENVEQEMNYTMRARFRNLCWETMFGQELISITVMDLIMTLVPSLGMDFFRGIFVRFMNRCWCWDLEKKFPKYGDFKVAENILSLVNNQGMVWMGMFFCPGLVVFNVFKLYITMYFKAWAVMTCNVPPEVIFRASRSNNFYYYLLLMMLFLCVLPVGYTIVWIKPSWHCGPFSKYKRIFHIFTKTIQDNVPEVLQRALDYIASPGIVIPLLVLLILIIYYLLSLTNSLREANEDLKIQLRRERTEERRKMFQLADRRRRGGSGESNELSNTPFNKWKTLIGNLPSGKSLDDTPKQEAEDVQNKDERIETRGKDFFSKFIKRALRKSSTSEDDQNAEDGTDTEQHDSLPYDTLTTKTTIREIKPSFSWGTTDFQNVARKALQLKKTKPEILPIKSSEITTEPKHVQINDKVNRENSDINRNTHSVREINRPRTESNFKDVTIHQNSDYNKNKTTTIKDDLSTRKDKSKHISRTRSNIKNTFPIKEEIIRDEPSTSKVIVRQNSDIIKINTVKDLPHNTTVPANTRQDSESSIWSDGIPVITISKTDSAENILDVCTEPWAEEEASTSNKNEDTQKFKPKIRCVLKKQATIDEDTIRYFNDDIERNISIINIIKAVAEEDIDEITEKLSPDSPNENSKGDEALTDKSSSEDTEQKESSTETILRSPQLIDED